MLQTETQTRRKISKSAIVIKKHDKEKEKHIQKNTIEMAMVKKKQTTKNDNKIKHLNNKKNQLKQFLSY